MVYCIVPFCTSNSIKDSVSFHEVPSDLIRRKKWTIAISRQGPEKGSIWNPKERDAVCEKHFLPSDYKIGCKQKRLKKDAIPSVFPSYPKYMSPKVSAVRRELFKHTVIKKCENSVQSSQPSVSNIRVKSETPLQSYTDELHDCINNSNADQMYSIHDSNADRMYRINNGNAYQKYSMNNSNADQKYMLLRKKFRRMTVTLSKTKKKLNALRVKSKELNRENRKLKKVLNKRHILNDIELEANLCHTDSAFLQDQINARKYKTPRWSEVTIKQCISWYRYSPSGYRYVRSTSMMKLPAISTLKKYIEYVVVQKQDSSCEA